MSESEKEKLEILADMLVATLGDVSPKDEDATVKKVALVMYNDLLGIEGEIKTGGLRLCVAGTTALMTGTKFIPSEGSDK